MRDHLRSIQKRHHSLIRQVIEQQLMHEPEVETRNRKPLLPATALDADWELRFGPDNRFRVFYTVDPEQREVQVLAIVVTRRNKLLVGGEEIKL